jgi:hypothetical protein
VSPRRFSELGGRERRQALVRSAAVVVLSWAGLIGVYYALPGAGRETAADDVLKLAVGLLVVAGYLAWQTSRIGRAELPELRAAQALGVVIPLFLLVFSTIYLSLYHSSRAAFSQPLDHTSALYFSITVFSTVGFGDITPRTDMARIVVAVQMLLDLVIIGVVVRLIFSAAKSGLTRGDEERPETT